jgi:hypothetical protein
VRSDAHGYRHLKGSSQNLPKILRLLYLVGDLPEQVRVQQYVPRDRLVAQSTKNFALPSRSNRPVAGEGCYDALMAQVLRPGLESLGIELQVVGELNQRVPERSGL